MGRRQRLKARARAIRNATKDVDAHLEKKRGEERIFGGDPSTLDSSSLFVVDKSGHGSHADVNANNVIQHERKIKLKGRALLDEPIKADDVLNAPHTRGAPAHVLNARQVYGRSSLNIGKRGGKDEMGNAIHDAEKSLKDIAGKKERLAKIKKSEKAKKRTGVIHNADVIKKSTDSSAVFDLWGDNAADDILASQNSGRNLEKVKVHKKLAAATKDVIRRAPGLAKPVTMIPAVQALGTGYSYNPSEESHRDAVLEEAARVYDEEKRKADEEARIAPLREHLRGKNRGKWNPRNIMHLHGEEAYERLVGEALAEEEIGPDGSSLKSRFAILAPNDNGDDSDSSDDAARKKKRISKKKNIDKKNGDGDGESDSADSDSDEYASDDSDEEGATRRTVGADGRKLTRAERNRRKLHEERVRAANELKKRKRDQSEIDRIGTHLKDVKRDLRMAEENKETNAAKKKRKLLAPNPKLARAPIKDDEVRVLLPEELPDNLRNTAGVSNLLKDRFLSLQRRNFVEPRRKVALKRAEKIPYVPGQRLARAQHIHEAREQRNKKTSKGKKKV